MGQAFSLNIESVVKLGDQITLELKEGNAVSHAITSFSVPNICLKPTEGHQISEYLWCIYYSSSKETWLTVLGLIFLVVIMSTLLIYLTIRRSLKYFQKQISIHTTNRINLEMLNDFGRRINYAGASGPIRGISGTIVMREAQEGRGGRPDTDRNIEEGLNW